MYTHHRLVKYFILLASMLMVFGCAISPPVQEMSNARQTLQAAREVNAARFAPNYLNEAENLLRLATEALDSGDYLSARDYAVSAQQQAIKARQKALSESKNH